MQTSNNVLKTPRSKPAMAFSELSEQRKGNAINRRKKRLQGRTVKRTDMTADF